VQPWQQQLCREPDRTNNNGNTATIQAAERETSIREIETLPQSVPKESDEHTNQ
jgi:hypothetical protein